MERALDDDPERQQEAHAKRPYVPGDLIASKYRLERIIGRGGMGSVFKARNVTLDIDVAIKLIRRDHAPREAGERLLIEARAAARLMHPSIVRVFDFGESDRGDPFIVMEFLVGESLSAILRRKTRLSPEVAVQTLLPVASALVSAHQKGIVHRDLKPDNVIVIPGDEGSLVPKVVDFGIAKLMSPDVDRHVTFAGEVLGSPDYMSPEQARGADDVGEATDVWALSVVLYELTTGVRPFDAPNYNGLIASILTCQPKPILAHGVLDDALQAILARGLEKDVTARFTTMRDLGVALATWAVSRGLADDVTGASISKQWLVPSPRRIFSVAAPAPSASRPEGAAGAAADNPKAGQSPNRAAAATGAIAPAVRTISRAAYYTFPLGALLGVLLVAAVASSRWRAMPAPGTTTSSASADTDVPTRTGALSDPPRPGTATPGAQPGAAPSPSVPSDAPGSSDAPNAIEAATPSATGSATAAGAKPTTRWKGRRKPSAPRVPRHINF
jgi:serine/threonine-protein kinase